MKLILIFSLVLLQFASWAEGEVISFITNEKVSSILVVQQKKEKTKGVLSLHFQSTPSQLRQGILEVKDLNLSFKNIQQHLLSNRKPRGKATGALGFTKSPANPVLLKYDPASRSLAGEIRGTVDFPQLAENTLNYENQKTDLIATPTQYARLNLKINLPEGLPRNAGDIQQKLPAKISLQLHVSPLHQFKINGYNIILGGQEISISYVFLNKFEVARKLCVQPVSILKNTSDVSPTGVGLSFGMPQANLQWKKTNIYFQVRGWKYIVNSALAIVDNAAEESQIRASVQDDDCIEVFFVENFSPAESHGGGATWSGGQVSSQIISADGNANGIDYTHLAHELGHALGLHHPNAGAPNATWPNLVDGSTGTLMCPSGWRRDNPQINSTENKANVSNPLLRFVFVRRGPTPDCNNSSDCGACF